MMEVSVVVLVQAQGGKRETSSTSKNFEVRVQYCEVQVKYHEVPVKCALLKSRFSPLVQATLNFSTLQEKDGFLSIQYYLAFACHHHLREQLPNSLNI